jgi:hypothetical protein
LLGFRRPRTSSLTRTNTTPRLRRSPRLTNIRAAVPCTCASRTLRGMSTADEWDVVHFARLYLAPGRRPHVPRPHRSARPASVCPVTEGDDRGRRQRVAPSSERRQRHANLQQRSERHTGSEPPAGSRGVFAELSEGRRGEPGGSQSLWEFSFRLWVLCGSEQTCTRGMYSPEQRCGTVRVQYGERCPD